MTTKDTRYLRALGWGLAIIAGLVWYVLRAHQARLLEAERDIRRIEQIFFSEGYLEAIERGEAE